jgi:hypothetical protein
MCESAHGSGYVAVIAIPGKREEVKCSARLLGRVEINPAGDWGEKAAWRSILNIVSRPCTGLEKKISGQETAKVAFYFLLNTDPHD